MKKEAKQQNSTDTQMGCDIVSAPVNVRWIPLTEKEPVDGFELLQRWCWWMDFSLLV